MSRAGARKGSINVLEAPELPIAPMIDVVFLLLIYFMVSSTIQRQEVDLSFTVPGLIQQSQPVEIPDEQIIRIAESGQAFVNDYPYDEPTLARYDDLARMLRRFRSTTDANQAQARITIAPSDRTTHEMVVKVMDACSFAGIDSVTFAR